MPATVSSFINAFIEVSVAAAIVFGLYLTVRHYYKCRWLQRHGLRTLGVVVRLEADTSDFEAAYYPVVCFQPVNQAPLEARYDLGDTPPAYAIGEKVLVLYDPDQPTRFVLGDESSYGWALVLAIGIVSGIFAYCWQYNLVL
jgi:hypothetical protein